MFCLVFLLLNKKVEFVIGFLSGGSFRFKVTMIIDVNSYHLYGNKVRLFIVIIFMVNNKVRLLIIHLRKFVKEKETLNKETLKSLY